MQNQNLETSKLTLYLKQKPLQTKAKPEKKKLGCENQCYVVRGTAGNTLLQVSYQSVLSLTNSCDEEPYPTQVMPSLSLSILPQLSSGM